MIGFYSQFRLFGLVMESWLEDFLAFHMAFLGTAFLVAGLMLESFAWNYRVVPIAESKGLGLFQ